MPQGVGVRVPLWAPNLNYRPCGGNRRPAERNGDSMGNLTFIDRHGNPVTIDVWIASTP